MVREDYNGSSAVVVFAGASFLPENNEWLVSSKIGSETESLAALKNIHEKYMSSYT